MKCYIYIYFFLIIDNMILFADQYESHLLVLTVGVDIVINQNLRKIIVKSARSLTRIYKVSKLSDLFEFISSLHLHGYKLSC